MKLTEIEASYYSRISTRKSANETSVSGTARLFLGEIVQDAVVETSSQAISDNSINPATQPKIDVTKFEDGEDLEYTMAFEVMPEISPADFKELLKR